MENDIDYEYEMYEQICSGNLEQIEVLLNAGVKINSKQYYGNGNTPLILAAKNGYFAIVQLLIDYGAEINILNYDGENALMLASGGGGSAYPEIAEYLISKGAEINVLNYGSENVLMLASCGGHAQIVDILVWSGVSINDVNAKGENALMYALGGREYKISEENIQTVKNLIAYGININAVTNDGYNALAFAARVGSKELLTLLKDCGIDVSAKSKYTALKFAARYCHVEVMQLLLSWEVETDSIYNINQEELLVAVITNNYSKTEQLISLGGKVNQPDNDGWTALMYAAVNGYAAICRLLIKNGACVNALNDQRWNSLMYAVVKGHFEIVQDLVSDNAEVNNYSYSGYTPIILAAKKGYLSIIKLLLKSVAKKNVRLLFDEFKWPALFHAAQNNHYNICKLLIEYGANVNATDFMGFTLLYRVITNSKKQNNIELVKLLLENGANPYIYRDNDSEEDDTLLNECAREGFDEIYLVLDSHYKTIASNEEDSCDLLKILSNLSYPEIFKILDDDFKSKFLLD